MLSRYRPSAHLHYSPTMEHSLFLFTTGAHSIIYLFSYDKVYLTPSSSPLKYCLDRNGTMKCNQRKYIEQKNVRNCLPFLPREYRYLYMFIFSQGHNVCGWNGNQHSSCVLSCVVAWGHIHFPMLTHCLPSLFVWSRVSLCSFGWLGIHDVSQGSLELMGNLHALASSILGL